MKPRGAASRVHVPSPWSSSSSSSPPSSSSPSSSSSSSPVVFAARAAGAVRAVPVETAGRRRGRRRADESGQVHERGVLRVLVTAHADVDAAQPLDLGLRNLRQPVPAAPRELDLAGRLLDRRHLAGDADLGDAVVGNPGGKAAVAQVSDVVRGVADRLEHGQHADRDDRQGDHDFDQREAALVRSLHRHARSRCCRRPRRPG